MDTGFEYEAQRAHVSVMVRVHMPLVIQCNQPHLM